MKNEKFARLKFVFKVHTQSTQQKIALENQDFFKVEMPHPEWWTRGGTNRGGDGKTYKKGYLLFITMA